MSHISPGIDVMEISVSYFHSHETLYEALRVMNAISLYQAQWVESGNIIERHLNKAETPGHPLTCGNDSNHAPLYPYWAGSNVCLLCRDCDYVQTMETGFDDETVK